MRPLTQRIAGVCAALLLGATLASAQSPDTNNSTIVTFSAPVSLPGVTLPAGSYLFQLADSKVNRNIVQVFAKDRSKIFATILAVPAERNEPADETVITFNESPANSAPAIRYWYYPGDKRGQEFAYPKKQAIEIANAAHTSVLAVDTDENNPESMKSAAMSRVEPGAEATAQAPAPQPSETQAPQAAAPAAPATPTPQAEPTPAPTPQPEQTPRPEQPTVQQQQTPAPSSTPTTQAPTSQPEQPVGTSGSTRPTAPREKLPKTASTLPLVGFAGLLALLSAFGVRTVRRARV